MSETNIVNQEVKTEKTNRRIKKGTLRKCFLNWMFFAHSSYNYERMQGTGFLHSLAPAITELKEQNPEYDATEGLKRHATFFNTEPRLGSMVVGLSVALEERIATGESRLADAVISIKNGLMGPISGIGDTIMQAILSPLLLSMALGLANAGNVLGPILYFVLFLVLVLMLGYWSFRLGYYKGDEAILTFIESGAIRKVIEGAGIMGCVVMGALVAKFVSLNTIISFEIETGVFDLQKDVFDAIMPKLLPLLLTLLLYKYLSREKANPLKAMGLIIVFAVVLGLIGIV